MARLSDFETRDSGFKTGFARASHDLSVDASFALEVVANDRHKSNPGIWGEEYAKGYGMAVSIYFGMRKKP